MNICPLSERVLCSRLCEYRTCAHDFYPPCDGETKSSKERDIKPALIGGGKTREIDGNGKTVRQGSPVMRIKGLVQLLISVNFITTRSFAWDKYTKEQGRGGGKKEGREQRHLNFALTTIHALGVYLIDS